MAIDIFIKIGDIKGEAKDSKHKEKIDVLAWSWGMSNSGSSHYGGGGGSGKVNVQDLSLAFFENLIALGGKEFEFICRSFRVH